ncbi:MAG: hypothetical protein LH603_22345, partial [Pseudonocardia sp.]|nr:hypothetical protein [Pseudonocardia sp.]
MRVLVHAPGPPGHGVVRHAAQVVELVRAHGVVTARRDVELTHVQFTDALFGPDIGRAAGAFEAWAGAPPPARRGTREARPRGAPRAARLSI